MFSFPFFACLSVLGRADPVAEDPVAKHKFTPPDWEAHPDKSQAEWDILVTSAPTLELIKKWMFKVVAMQGETHDATVMDWTDHKNDEELKRANLLFDPSELSHEQLCGWWGCLNMSWGNASAESPDASLSMRNLQLDRHDIMKMMRESTSENLVLFDIGAGPGTNGLAAVKLAQSLGKQIKVVAIEPSPELFFTLLENMKRNGIERLSRDDLTGNKSGIFAERGYVDKETVEHTTASGRAGNDIHEYIHIPWHYLDGGAYRTRTNPKGGTVFVERDILEVRQFWNEIDHTKFHIPMLATAMNATSNLWIWDCNGCELRSIPQSQDANCDSNLVQRHSVAGSWQNYCKSWKSCLKTGEYSPYEREDFQDFFEFLKNKELQCGCSNSKDYPTFWNKTVFSCIPERAYERRSGEFQKFALDHFYSVERKLNGGNFNLDSFVHKHLE